VSGNDPARATAEERRVRVAAAVVWDGDRILLTQRPPGGALGLQWEFPGGKLEPGESPEAAVVREVREELGTEARVVERMHVEQHDYAHGVSVEITFLRCTLDPAALVPGRGVYACRWLRPRDIDVAEVLEADRSFVRSLGAR
jgi:mutator protein MutT